MKRSALGSHRTGHPRCVQFSENATKSVSPRRRSHAPIRSDTPAHRSAAGASNTTSTVSPTANCSTGPMSRHTSCSFRKMGPSTKTNGGSEATAAASPPKAREARDRNVRRGIVVDVSLGSARTDTPVNDRRVPICREPCVPSGRGRHLSPSMVSKYAIRRSQEQRAPVGRAVRRRMWCASKSLMRDGWRSAVCAKTGNDEGAKRDGRGRAPRGAVTLGTRERLHLEDATP